MNRDSVTRRRTERPSTMRDPEKPQQIIEAAIRVFARNGYYSSRVSDIAREAGIASGTIYLYFKTKEEILVTLFREKMAAFVAYLRREIAQVPEPEARLRRLVLLHFTVLEQNPALAEVVQVELRQGHKFFRGASAHEVAAYFELIGSILEEGVAGGRLAPGPPVEGGAQMRFGGLGQGATPRGRRERGDCPVEAADPVAPTFLKGVTRNWGCASRPRA